MDTNTGNKPSGAGGSFNSVKAVAKQQRHLRLNKEKNDTQLRDTLHGIRTLKRKATEEAEMAEPVVSIGVVAQAWDWFQRSIGNR